MATTSDTSTSTAMGGDAQSLDIGLPGKLLPPAVFRHWVHHREEDRGDVEMYRPFGTPLPPSFARDGFEMRRDGTFIQDVIAPTDGTVQITGRWRQAGPNRVVARFASRRQPDYAFEIVSVDEKSLRRRLMPIPTDDPAAPASDEVKLADYHKLPPATTARRIDFERADVRVLESFPPQYVLVVSGVKPFLNMDVTLEPVVYIRQPEFWEIEVVGRLRGIGLTAVAPYTVSLNLAGSMGSVGVDVMGATRRERIPVLRPSDEA